MDATAMMRAGRLDEARALLQATVRHAPADVGLRTQLFGLECVLGHFEKAHDQIASIASLDPGWILCAHAYQALIRGEFARRNVFAGQQPPLFLGKPPGWAAAYAAALMLAGRGSRAEARQMLEEAGKNAPKFPARVNEATCGWLKDADERIGPIIEAWLNGTYYWIPFCEILRLTSEPPTQLTEVVWLPAQLQLFNKVEVSVYLPARYPDTESSSDADLRLGRRTSWHETAGGDLVPLGQKMFENDQGVHGLLECRTVEFLHTTADVSTKG